jgi:hypothetical protein
MAGLGMLVLILAKRKKKIAGALGLLVLLSILTASTGHAAPLCTSLTQNYAAYESAGSCTVDNVTFSNFSYTASGTGSASTANKINVTVIDMNGEVGFQFNPTWTVSTTHNENVSLSYNAISTVPITQFSASDTVTVSGTGTIAGTANLQVVSPPSTLATEQFACTTSNCKNGGSTALNPLVAPNTSLLINNNLTLTSTGASLSNSAHVSNLKNTIQESNPVPEPTTLFLAGSALIGIGVIGRRYGKKRP